MTVYAYAIKSLKDGRIYVGQAADIEKRLAQHNSGITKSTKYYRPWQLLYSKGCINRIEARKLEK
jgi:putative endonuclease